MTAGRAVFDGVLDEGDDLVQLLCHRLHADELAQLLLGAQIQQVAVLIQLPQVGGGDRAAGGGVGGHHPQLFIHQPVDDLFHRLDAVEAAVALLVGDDLGEDGLDGGIQ